MEILEDEMEISLEEIWEVVKKNWKLLAVCTVVAAVLGFLVNQFLVAPTYTASSRLYIMNTTQANNYDANGEQIVSATDLNSSLMLSKDYIEILQSERVTKAAAQRMGLLNLSDYGISVTSAADTRMIKIVVTGTDQKGVAKLANILTEEFTACVQQIMHMDNVTVIDTATVPAGPSGPAKMKNTMLCAMVGLMIALAISFLRYFLDTTIKSSDDIERYLNLPVLAKIPDFTER